MGFTWNAPWVVVKVSGQLNCMQIKANYVIVTEIKVSSPKQTTNFPPQSVMRNFEGGEKKLVKDI